MSVNTSIGLIGVAKQANKSTAAASPTFVHGLTGGSTFKLDMTIEADDAKFDAIMKQAQKAVRKVEPDCRILLK